MIFHQVQPTSMSNMTVHETMAGSEAGKLQTDFEEVFGKILSQTKRIDMSLTLGDNAEALGHVRELEAYLERGLEVLSRPLERQP